MFGFRSQSVEFMRMIAVMRSSVAFVCAVFG